MAVEPRNTRRALFGGALALMAGGALAAQATERPPTWEDVLPVFRRIHVQGAKAVAVAKAEGFEPSQIFAITMLKGFALCFRTPTGGATVFGDGKVVR